MSPSPQPARIDEPPRSAPHPLQERLDHVIEGALAAQRVVGTVVVVLQDGQVTYRRAAGFADREAGQPMRADTIFRLSSVTKPMVTFLALRLVELGSLSLADPVTRYLPEFRPRLRDGQAPEISLHQLLTHTGGLSYAHQEPADGPYLRAEVSDGLDQPGLSMSEELRRIEAAGLAYAPGSRWGYSVGLDVLGAVIERATAQSLPELMRHLVTAPLGMHDTGFAAPERGRLATPYRDGSPPVRMGELEIVPFLGLSGVRLAPGRAFDATSFASGGAGMNGTADDVARLLEAVRTGGAGVLQAQNARAMWTNQVGELPIAFGPGWGFGYGGAVVTDPRAANTPQSVGTFSWGGVWGHSWFVDPAHKLVLVALTNTSIEGMAGAFPMELRDAVYA